jgi:F-type H+-transporting ATPase subunit delta
VKVSASASSSLETVTNYTAATRYARALFDVARKEETDLSRIESELSAFGALLKEHPALERVLENRAVPAPRKRAVIVELNARTEVAPVLAKLLLLLAERDRLTLLPNLLASFRQRLLDHQNVVRAEVTVAIPLSDDLARSIERSLARVTGRTISMSTRVDPSILGGIVARVGGTVFDGSITNHLQRMRQRLEESV